MSDWRPIQTAPKDGTVVDLWMVDQDGIGKRVPDAWWTKDTSYRFIEFTAAGQWSEKYVLRDGWFAENYEYDNSPGFCDYPRRFNAHPLQKKWMWSEPTHWMPLPEPPKESEK